jgi:bacterioferritin
MFQQNIVAENAFLGDILATRETARTLMAARDPQPVPLLQTLLTAEIACILRYSAIAISADGLKNAWIGAEFQEQSNDERKHMTLLAGRIEQLGGTPDFNPQGLALRAAGSPSGQGDLPKRVHENLAAERCVIEHYRDMITHFAKHDPMTAAMLEEIMREEEDHTSDMEDLLAAYGN